LICLTLAVLFRDEIAEFFELGKDLLRTLFNRLFVCLDNDLGMFWLFIGIIYTREVFDLALVNKLIETLDITPTTDL
jgi:hypothetical protein